MILQNVLLSKHHRSFLDQLVTAASQERGAITSTYCLSREESTLTKLECVDYRESSVLGGTTTPGEKARLFWFFRKNVGGESTKAALSLWIGRH